MKRWLFLHKLYCIVDVLNTTASATILHVLTKSVNNNHAKKIILLKKKATERENYRAKTDPRFVEKILFLRRDSVFFDTLIAAIQSSDFQACHQSIKTTSIKGDDKSEGKADKQIWLLKGVFFIQVPASASELIIPAFLIQTTHDWLGWSTVSSTVLICSVIPNNEYLLQYSAGWIFKAVLQCLSNK